MLSIEGTPVKVNAPLDQPDADAAATLALRRVVQGAALALTLRHQGDPKAEWLSARLDELVDLISAEGVAQRIVDAYLRRAPSRLAGYRPNEAATSATLSGVPWGGLLAAVQMVTDSPKVRVTREDLKRAEVYDVDVTDDGEEPAQIRERVS